MDSNPLYFSEPFSRHQAFNDLVILSQHRGRFLYKRGNKVVSKSGEIATSSRMLAMRWQWSRGKVESFLRDLEKNGDISMKRNNVATIIKMTQSEILKGGMPNVIIKEQWVHYIDGLPFDDQNMMFWAILNYGMYGIVPTHINGRALQYFESCICPDLDNQRKKWFDYIKKKPK